MIGYLEGKLLKKESERILLFVNHIGYEILLPPIVMETLNAKSIGDEITLYIYYHQSEKQPKPVLIGFNLEVEKEFFQYFISVEDIGPLKALKALTMPVRDISRAIESKDAQTLKQLKGIGNRTAQKIIATLEGKLNKFALIRKSEQPYEDEAVSEDFVQTVIDLLVSQLGYKPGEAKTMVVQALKRNKFLTSPEDLLEEVYRGERT